MASILIVAATKTEIQPLIERFGINANSEEGLFKSILQDFDLSVLITGVGMVNTSFIMGKFIQRNYDYLINAGICGSFNRSIEIGEVLDVCSDTFSEMGAEDGDKFIPYSKLGLGGDNSFRNNVNFIYEPYNNLKKVTGITVNTVHGNEQNIQKIIARVKADTESMEGAAFFRACAELQSNYIQIRAVSNYVEKRDKSKWNIPLAVKNLNEFTMDMIFQLNSVRRTLN